MAMSLKEANINPNRVDQKRNSFQHIIVKMPSAKSKERILKAVRGKCHLTYKGKPISFTPDYTTETMKARRS